MKFGLAFASSIGTEADSAIEICLRAEALGFESVWGGEHVIYPTHYESAYPYTADRRMPAEPETVIPDPLIWLAYVAGHAPSLRLGTCILILPQRNPVVLAKEIATLDRLSGGRVELGIGLGWLREEFDALGIPWDQRGARTDEYVEAMQALWAGPHAEYHGKFVDFDPVTCSPRPIQDRIPILVGGDTSAAIGRAARLADGYFPGAGDLPTLQRLIDELHVATAAHDRSPHEVEVNAMFAGQMADPVAGAEQLAEIGVGRAMVPAFFFAGPGGLDRLTEFGERVVAPISA